MKKITLLCMATLFYTFSYAQVLNQPANWPNTNWGVTGTYNTDPNAFEADPTLTANFAFDDDDAGFGSADAIAAESPAIDLSAAFAAGEIWITVSVDYTYNDLDDTLNLEYWDADAATWVVWQQLVGTVDQPLDNFCGGTRDSFISNSLDITAFTATQQSGFQYRLSFDDLGDFEWGFCFDSPTISSSAPPTCIDISNLTSANITATTADISWDANTGETAWEVAIQNTGTGIPTGSGTAVTTNAPYAATGLNSGTNYEVYVRADCAVDGFSNWIGPINFITLNLPPPPPVGVTCTSGTPSFIFIEDFDDNPPSGWTGTGFDGSNGNWDITAGNNNSIDTGPSASFNGATHLEYEASGNATDIASAISPPIDLTTAVDGAELSFYLHAFGANMGTLNVSIGNTPTGPFTNIYAWTGDLQTADTDAWVPIGINLDAYLGQAVYLEFSYGGAGTGFEGDLSIDFIRVEACGSFCIAPSNLAVSNITDSAVDLNWLANSGETEWEYVVQPAGTGIPTGAGTSTTTNPITVTGLNSSTNYEVYVRAICGPGQESVWTGPITFISLPEAPVGVTCTSGTSTIIFTEDFGDNPPLGWTGTGFDGTNGNWDITTGANNSIDTGPSVSFNGGTHLEYEASGDSTDIASAISPPIDLTTAVDGAELSFYLHAFGADMGTLNVNIGNTPTGPFTNIYSWSGDLQTADTDPWVPVGINLDAYLGQTVYIEFSYGGAGTGFEGDLSIDLIQVEACGSFCVAPSNLASANIMATTADISWDINSGETAWEIVIQNAGTGVPTGPGTAVTTNAPYAATGLNPSTDYEVYVRADCGVDGVSTWVGPINFTTLNLPPPPPVGVTCTSGTSTIIFTEDFDDNPPLGWTGTGFDGSNGNWDITAGDNNSGGTGPFTSFSGGTHLEYEASGSATDIASAISPLIDLTPAVDGAELSFNLHAFGADMGTLNVNIGNTPTGPFTNLYTWSGDLQTADTDAWVPIGINLDAYLGQTVYIEFSYGGAGTGFEGDLSIDLIQVEACGSFCIAPNNLVTSNVTNNSADLNWVAVNGETEWEYVVQPAGTGAPTGAGTSTTTNPVTATGLLSETDYEVYIRAICGPGEVSTWTGPVNFTTTIGVDCTGTPITTSYCYGNNDTTTFSFTSSDGTSPLALIFNAGGAEVGFDGLIVTDTDGTVLFNGDNGGDLTGLSFESVGNTITVQVFSDGSINCQASGFTPWNFTVGCFDPTGPPSCVSLIDPQDGDNAVDIIGGNITWGNAIGSPAGYILLVGTTPGGTDIVNGVDVGNVNTYALGDLVYSTTYYVTILPYNGNGLATGCAEESFSARPDPMQVFNIVCADGPISLNHCYTNNDDNTYLYTSDNGFPMELVFSAGTILDDNDIIIIYDGSDNTFPELFNGNNGGDLSGLTITSGLGNLYMEVISDGVTSCSTGTGDPWAWTVRCLTCFGPTATYTIVEDCAEGDQFLVDVEITNTGDAASITLNDDFGSPSQVITTPGVYTFGPYPNATEVVLTVADTDDLNCILTSEPLTQAFCPDQACGIINAGYDQVQACQDTSTDLSATFMASAITNSTSSYIISDLDCPPENLTGLPTSITVDDNWSSVINLGFNFQFFGQTYTQLVIGANGLISFDPTIANLDCEWNFDADIPNPDLVGTIFDPLPAHRAAVFGAYHDIDPSVAGDHYIEYVVVGTAPARQFKVTFFEIPHFSAVCNNLLTTQQIILYESSNVVDVIIIDKPTCPTWNDGNAAIGIQNEAGNVGYAPPGRNTSDSPWTVTSQELWRFVPDGNPNYTFEWLDPDGNVISNNTDITVSPTVDTTYTASITYALADGSLVTLTDDVTVTIEPSPEVIATQTLEACDDNIDGLTVFDLTQQDANAIGVQVGVSATYYETLADAEAGTNAITPATAYTNTTPNLQTVYVRVEDDITGCYGTGSFDLVVLPKQLLGPIASLEVCDDDTDGFTEFNLSTQDGVIIGPLVDVTVSYYETLADADNSTNEIATPAAYTNTTANLQTVYVRLEEDLTGCFSTGSFDLIVLPKPIVTMVTDLEACEDGTTGFTQFNLLQDADIIGTQTGMTVSYYETQADADAGTGAITNPTAYTNIVLNTQTIYVRIENNVTSCYQTDTFELTIVPNPIVASVIDLEVCDDDFDGIAVFDLTLQDVNVIGSQMNVLVTYYETQADALAGVNVLADPTMYVNTTPDSEVVYVRVENNDALGCFTTGSFNVIALPQIDPNDIGIEGECINEEYTISTFPLNGAYDNATVTYEWSGGTSTNNTGSQFIATDDGEYTVSITNADGCVSMKSFTVVNSMCSFPKGISPNGDGLNDNWNLAAFRVLEVEIFNSHGRSLYKKANYVDEWYGQTNDNDALPVGTYFYVLKLENGQSKNGWIYLNK